jgi:hypothetical protein
MSSSTDGTTFSAPALIQIAGAPLANEFGQGFAIAPGTSGSTAQMSVVYNTTRSCGTTPDTKITKHPRKKRATNARRVKAKFKFTFTSTAAATPCIDARYATSYDGGATWSASYQINPSDMPVGNFIGGPRGKDLGDYNSVSFVGGAAITVMPLALTAPSGGTFSQKEYGFSAPVGFKPVLPAGPTFQCKRDHKKWKDCSSGKKKYKVKVGKHKFKVRATANGLTDPTPAKFKFKVVRKP